MQRENRKIFLQRLKLKYARRVNICSPLLALPPLDEVVSSQMTDRSELRADEVIVNRLALAHGRDRGSDSNGSGAGEATDESSVLNFSLGGLIFGKEHDLPVVVLVDLKVAAHVGESRAVVSLEILDVSAPDSQPG